MKANAEQPRAVRSQCYDHHSEGKCNFYHRSDSITF